MNTIQYRSYGGAEVLTLAEAPEPVAKEGQVVVAVKAAGINPFDLKLRSGMFKDFISLTLPVVFGGDFSGVVESVGKGVTGFAIGDEMYGSSIVLGGGSGSFAQKTAANSSSIAKKPKKSSFEEAAALVLVGVSALQALEDHMKLKKGQKILIHGGAGGIGHIAVQMAKAIGAYVYATASANDLDFVKALGADEVIDYTSQKFETLVSGIDGVFDTVGGDTFIKSFLVLNKGGALVTMAGQPDEALAKQYGVTVVDQNTKTNTDHLNRLTKYVDDGRVHVHIGGSFPLADVRKAAQLAEGHVQGKVVVTI